jgi:hypothetical protein
MEIAGDYEPKPGKEKPGKAQKTLSSVKRAAASASCHIKLLSLCL